MIIDDQQYDIIIIGTGAGGGTLAQKLAPTGKKILILERGDYMPLTEQNRTHVDVFKRERYHAPEQWYDRDGEPFSPQTNYAVGGNTKIYAAALMRMRDRDFEAVQYQAALSPEWPIKYSDLEPYYSEAEQLYQVHGNMSADPTEPEHSQSYPHGPVEYGEVMAGPVGAIAAKGFHPTALPLSLTDQDDDPTGDAEIFGIKAALKFENVTLKTQAKVVALHTNSSGQTVKAVEAKIGEASFLFLSEIVVLACGAINSAALLLRSDSELHPQGLANASGQVGRNLMKHQMTAIVQRSSPNSGTFLRNVSVNDFYWGKDDFPYPMGHIENTGGLLQDVIFAESPPVLSVLAKLMPGFGLEQLAKRSIGWWVQTPILPDPDNRVRLNGKKICIDYQANNTEAHERLVYGWTEVLKATETQRSGVYPKGEAPIQVVAHQVGTCRMGLDPATSVLDVNCKAHHVDNLYVVDGSFFPSLPGVSPALTIMANALRVGDHLKAIVA